MNFSRTNSRRTTLLFALYFLIFALTAQAQVLPPNGSVDGELNATTTSITYSFTVPSDGDGTFTITPSAGLYANIQFYDQNGTSFVFESPLTGTGNPSSFTVPHLNAGATYYFQAFRRTAGNGTFTLSNTFTPQAIANDTEPNDGVGTALSVAMPATRTGHLGYSRSSYHDRDSADWYAFTVPSDGNLTLTLTPTETLYANIQFFDSDGATFRFESPLNGTGAVSAFTIPHLNPGTTYYLQILNRTGGYGGYTLTSAFVATPLANDTEPNDTPASALALAMPTSRTGHLGFSRTSFHDRDNEDWYKFTVPADGDLTLTITPTSILYVNIQFYDSDGATFRFESPLTGAGNASSFTIPHLSGGATYYFRVFNRSGDYGSYTLEGTFTATAFDNDAEPNDGPGSAISVAMSATRRGHLGYSRSSYHDRDGEDWYKFTVPADGNLTVTLTPTSTLYANVQFFDSDGATFRFESPLQGTGNPSTFTIPHLNPGTSYYLRVLNRSAGYGSYTLRGSFAQIFPANDTELNDTPLTGIEISMPNVKTGHLGYSRSSYHDRDNEDWYAFTVPADGDVVVNVTPTSTLYVNVQFFDSDGATLRFESPLTGTGNPSTFIIPHLNPGTTYYLRVLNRSGDYGAYVLTGHFMEQFVVNDEEVNDGPGSAIAVASFNKQTGHLGYSRSSFHDRDSEDWYTFSHPGGNIDITLVNSNLLYANLQLFASDGTTYLIESPLTGTGNPSQLLTSRPAGTYFIRVVNRSAGYGAYGLNPGATIRIFGNIVLEDCVTPLQDIIVEVRPESGSPITYNLTDGPFDLTNLPRQNYSVSFKGTKWLRRTEIVDSNIGDVFIINALLLAGDADDDNVVSVLDLDILVQAFDLCEGDPGYDARADFNCDGCLDVLDLDLIIRNFDKLGND